MAQTPTIRSESILIDVKKQEQLSATGYAIFPLLDKAALQKLIEYYGQYQEGEPAQFYSSTHSADKDFRKKTSEFIKQTLGPLLSPHFTNHKLLGGAFVVKPAHGKGLLPPHQDWNLVDETTSRSYNIWIPLTRVNFENGAMCVLPGSHAQMATYRGSGIPSIFKNIEPLVWENLQVLEMEAGEALLYDHALLHASPVNSSANVRLGVVCGLIKSQANMQLYFNTPDNIEAYEINEHFFMDKDPNEGPEGLNFITSVSAQVALDEKQFRKVFANAGKKSPWFKRLFKHG